MKDAKNIELVINEALCSIDHIRGAGPGPFFFTRVQARLNTVKTSVWETASNILSRPGVAIAGISLIIIMNLIVLFSREQTGTALADQPDQFTTEEYNMAVTSFYEYQNPEP